MKATIYKNLYSSTLQYKTDKYEINALFLKSSKHYEIAVYNHNYELMTDYIPRYATFQEAKKDLRMWLNILNFPSQAVE